MNQYRTFWVACDGSEERLDTLADVRRYAAAGVLIREVSAEQQQREADMQMAPNVASMRMKAQIEAATAGRAHANSPGGKAETALRFARAHPGGIVTSSSPASELEAFSPKYTNPFK